MSLSILEKTGTEVTNQGIDVIDNPSHYNFGKYEVIDVLEDWFNDDPLLWQVGKYIARAKYKNSELDDLCKARYYLNRKIRYLENKVLGNK